MTIVFEKRGLQGQRVIVRLAKKRGQQRMRVGFAGQWILN